MKKLLFILFSSCTLFSCTNDRYIDLNTGEAVVLEKDPKTGLLVSTETKKPVEIYVDTKTHDTIYGLSGKIINGSIIRTNDGVYRYENEANPKIEADAGDYKKKVDKDGDVKIKDGDTKIKIDGETGKKTVKKD